MTHAQSSGSPAPHAEHEPLGKWLSTAAALAVGGVFFALWFWLLPGWLGFRVETAGAARWRWLAAIPSVLGFAVALRCVWDFGWIGLWIVFGHANPRVIAAVAAVALGVHLFVVFYEEPTLRKKFGADYEEYCRNVRRWWPRLRAWSKP